MDEFKIGDIIDFGLLKAKVCESLSGHYLLIHDYWTDHNTSTVNAWFKLSGIPVKRIDEETFPYISSLKKLTELIGKLKPITSCDHRSYKLNDEVYLNISVLNNEEIVLSGYSNFKRIYDSLINMDEYMKKSLLSPWAIILNYDNNPNLIKVGCQVFELDHLRKVGEELMNHPRHNEIIKLVNNERI